MLVVVRKLHRWLLPAVLLLTACSAVLGIHDPKIDPVSQPSDGGPEPEDAEPDAGEDAEDAGENVTPPDMVRVPGPDGGTFLIDMFEVTQVQYARFLEAGVSFLLPPRCIQKREALFWPDAKWFSPDATPNLPVVGVDWCDAFAYCQSIGRRLCGAFSGTDGAPDSPSSSEWPAACTRGGSQAYPYGSTLVTKACNDSTVDPDAAGRELAAVGEFADCVGGYVGLHDMVGNAREWVNHCAYDGGRDECVNIGGSFRWRSAGGAFCQFSNSAPWWFRDNDIGFRCCK